MRKVSSKPKLIRLFGVSCIAILSFGFANSVNADNNYSTANMTVEVDAPKPDNTNDEIALPNNPDNTNDDIGLPNKSDITNDGIELPNIPNHGQQI